MHFDLIVRNARLPLSAQPGSPRDIAVWGERIAAITAPGELPRAEREFDAAGTYAVPGFNDVHAHSVWFGQTLLEIDLSGAKDPGQVYRLLREGAGSAAGEEESEWIIASGFSPAALAAAGSGDGLDIGELDRLAGGRPLLIKHNSGHALTVNSEALRRAGLNHAPTVEGGRVVTDAAGKPTGVLEENAMRPVQALLQPEPLKSIEKALGLASRAYAEQGITSVTDAGIAGGWIGHSPLELAAYHNALDRGMLRHRAQVMVTLDALHDVPGNPGRPAALALDTGLRTGLGDSHLQIGPVKIFTDGSLIGTTAALRENYCHCGHAGYFQGDPEQMRRQALRAAASGWSLAMHAIGDAAVDLAIDTIAAATAAGGRPAIPHRIEHGGVVTDEQVGRIAELGIALAPQPRFIAEFGDHMARVLGPRRVEDSYPAARLLRAGAILPGSSDRPVASGNPLEVIESFVRRRTESGAPYAPGERITAAAALRAYTEGSAAATGWAREKGRIAEGYLADIAFLDLDITAAAPEEISRARVCATLCGGRLTFAA